MLSPLITEDQIFLPLAKAGKEGFYDREIFNNNLSPSLFSKEGNFLNKC